MLCLREFCDIGRWWMIAALWGSVGEGEEEIFWAVALEMMLEFLGEAALRFVMLWEVTLGSVAVRLALLFVEAIFGDLAV